MSNVVIIINKYYNIYVCIIDNIFFCCRNKIYCWTITNNLSSFFDKYFTNDNFMVMSVQSVYTANTFFIFITE